jgi:hypothetical protein
MTTLDSRAHVAVASSYEPKREELWRRQESNLDRVGHTIRLASTLEPQRLMLTATPRHLV